MNPGALRRYDVQARYAVALAIIAIVPLLGGVVMLLRNYERELGHVVYGSGGRFVPLFLACLALSGLPGGLAFILGWSSAGQRRNDKPNYSWIGLFVGGSVATGSVILLIAFWMLRLQQPA